MPVRNDTSAPRPNAMGAAMKPRIDALDMTKGALVVAMVIYHSLNYSTDHALGFIYLPFLPPSFILITGFLISRLYFNPEAARDRGVHGRLLIRGFRLLVLFTLLNVVTQLVGRHKFAADPQGIAYLSDYWFVIYGIGGAKFAAFSILLPIAYLLLLAPLLILMDRQNGVLVPVIAVSLVIVSAIFRTGGEPSVNLGLLSIGLIGVVLGGVPANVLSMMGRYWYVAVAVYLGYLALSQLPWQDPFDQLVDACLALTAIFSVCAAIGSKSSFGRQLLTLGKYSLLAYISQIVVLQILCRLFDRLKPFSFFFFLEILGVLLVMVFLAQGLEWARKRMNWVDACYRIVFA